MLTEPRRPPAIRERQDAHWLVVATVCIGAFMGQLDASIVTVAFPTLRADFHASLGAVEWVSLAYLLILVGTVAAVGRLGDMIGRKLLYTYGFGVFTLASALCGFAPNLGALDGFRVLQALGAAMLQANSVALIAAAMPTTQLGRGIGVQGAAQALGLALGPTIGGLLLAAGGWKLIFFVNVPFGLLGLTLGWFLLPRTRHLRTAGGFDWIGLSLMMPGVGALLAALSLGRGYGFGSPVIMGLFAAAVVTLAAFVWWERRVAEPLVDLALFRRAAFSAGISSGLLSYSVLFGVLFVMPFLLEGGLHLHGGGSGLVLTALPAALGVTAPLAGRLADAIGSRPLTVTGMLVVAAGLGGIMIWHDSPAAIAVLLALIGAGLGAFTSPNNAAIMASAPREQSGAAGGLLNMTRGIGTALGVALTGMVFAIVSAHGTSDGGPVGATANEVIPPIALLIALSLVAAGAAGCARPMGRSRSPGSPAPPHQAPGLT